MYNLYEYEMTPEVMQSLKDHYSLVDTAYLDVLRGRNGPQRVYPNYEAPVIRSLATSFVTSCRCAGGFPALPFYKIKANVMNVRNTASGYWKPYLKAGLRCLVPATAFSEPDRNTSKSVVFRWFARRDASCSTSPASGASGRVIAERRRRRTSASTCCFPSWRRRRTGSSSRCTTRRRRC